MILKNIFLALSRDYFKLKGRANRAEFWSFQLFIFVMLTLLFILLYYHVSLGFYGLVGFIALIIIPYFTLFVRRLHDLNISGFVVLFCFFILPFIFLVALIVLGETNADSKYFSYLAMLEFIAKICILVAFYALALLKGSKGTNKYGEVR